MSSRGQLEFIYQQGLPIKFLIDVGAGLPNYNGVLQEAWLAKKLWPAIEVVGFEPQPDRYNSLLEAKYPGWLLMTGITNASGRILLHLLGQDMNAGLHGDTGEQTWEVDVERLDVLMNCRPDLSDAILWLDIEGSERDALLGATLTLEKCTAVVVELWPEARYPGWCTEDEVTGILKDAGFRFGKAFPSGPTDPQRDEVWLR